MDLQCQLLLFLDKRHILPDMKIKCEMFLEEVTDANIRKFPPFRYLLEIDVMELIDTFPELGDCLLEEPLKWQRMCNDILFACLQSVNNFDKNVEFAQVAVNLRLKSLPPCLVRPNPRYSTGLVSIQGLIIAISKPTSYVYHAVWSCPEECEGNEVILHYIPKTTPKCYMCKSTLFENSGLRRCGEQVAIKITLKNDLLFRSFNIVDDLIPKLKLGAKFILHVIVLKKQTVVWSVEELITLPAPMTHPIPGDIEEIYYACDSIPWKFIYCLASSIGINICPLNCFMHLKLNLLLSLASVKASIITGSSIVHVLVAGMNTGYVNEIMNEAAKLADTSIFFGTTHTVVSTSLIGSSGGVCVMPLPLHVYNQKQIFSIISAVESGEIFNDNSKVKLQSAVWIQGTDAKKNFVYNAANVFGNVCRGDYGENNDDITEFVLQRALEPIKITKEEKQALTDIKFYIDLVAGIKVSLDNTTETLLSNYFLAARKRRPGGVSVGSMGVLVAICLTSARLCRRSVANIDDAVLAIWLHVSGGPEPRFAPDERLQTPADVKKLQKMMTNFKDWLTQFTGGMINT